MKKLNECINQKDKGHQNKEDDANIKTESDKLVKVKKTNSEAKNDNLKEKGLYVIGIIVAGIIGYNIVDYIKQPDTFSELQPMMEDAREFDSRASDMSMAYDSIEDAIGEDEYFDAIESTYMDSTPDIEYSVQKMQSMDEDVKNSGGIATYEDLQTLRQEPLDPLEQERVEKAMVDYGINKE